MESENPFDAPSLQVRVDPNDARMFVQFYKKSAYDKAASLGYAGPDGKEVPGAGRPIFKVVDYVRIAAPGDQWNITDREVLPTDKQRFPLQWAAYQNGNTQETAAGTPLSVLTSLAAPIINEAQVDEFRHFHINTVEQLANLPDAVAAKFMGAQSLKQKAAAYLEATKGDAKLGRFVADLEKKDDEIAALKAQMEALTAQFAAQQGKAEAKPKTK